MKVRHRARKTALIIVTAAALAAAAVYMRVSGRQNEMNALSGYDMATASTGTISKTVFGSGPVEASDKLAVKAGASGGVLMLNVERGQAVKAGDLLLALSDKALKSEIEALKAQVRAKEQEVSASRVTSSANITSPIAGRVMEIYISTGEDITALSGRDEYIMLLSADGRMNLKCDGSSLEAGAAVEVEINGKTVKGYVTEIEDGLSTVIIDTDEFHPGSGAVIIKPNGERVAAIELNVNAPYYLSGYSGVVKKISVKELDTVTVGTTLIWLETKQYPADYLDKIAELEKARKDLNNAEDKLNSLEIRAEIDGIINSVLVGEGDSVKEGMQLISISDVNRMRLAINVDEVDILSIQTGQDAKIRFDAYPEAVIDAKVEEISRAGTIQGDVTSYPVYVYFEGGDRIFEGMHASADIEIRREDNSVIVPLEAVVSEAGGKFVRVPSGTSFELIPVTLGVVNEISAQVLSGLNHGAQVLVPKTNTGMSLPFMNMGGNRTEQTKSPGASD